MQRALVWDGLQGANRSRSAGYGEDLQRRRPPKAGMRCARGTCSALPYALFAGVRMPTPFRRAACAAALLVALQE